MPDKAASDSEAALISVHDRSGVVELARALEARGVVIYATSGTHKYLSERGIAAREIAELTGFPSLFAGRVKTLHPHVFGGILAKRNDPVHERERREHGIPRIGTVVVNLYPFEATIADPKATLEEAIEQIDIGGVSLIRAAAKNFEDVIVLVEPSQYSIVVTNPSGLGIDLRRSLALRAFQRTAEYDAAIARYLGGSGQPVIRLRYGENPHSQATFSPSSAGLPEQLGGKPLSYNNLLDLDAALRLLVRAPMPEEGKHDELIRAAIVKHTIPCGVAERDSASEAVRLALDADRISAFGGIVALDGRLDLATAEILGGVFLEIVAAPAFDDDALARLRRKKDLRIIGFDADLPERLSEEAQIRSAMGGLLTEFDDPTATPESWRVVSRRQPGAGEWRDLRLAWDVVRHVKSNGIVVARDRVTHGICAGQTNRVDAVRIAAGRAGQFARGAACASDGFFPFSDGLLAAADAGCSAVIAPGGSIRDAEVIAAADARDVALIFSTHRYFLH